MSSLVGPSPPVISTTRASVSARSRPARMPAAVSATLRCFHHVQPGLGQPLRQVGRIGIGHLADQNFVADGQNICFRGED